MNNNPTYPFTVSARGNLWQVWNISTGQKYHYLFSNCKAAHNVAEHLAILKANNGECIS